MHIAVATPKDTEKQWFSCFGASEAKNIVPRVTQGNVAEILIFILN
jgi:hypothetical protein